MKRHLLSLVAAMTLVPACGDRRAEGNEARAAVEDTTAAPSSDLGTPTKDTAADTGSREVRMRPYDGPMVPAKGDTAGRSGSSPQ